MFAKITLGCKSQHLLFPVLKSLSILLVQSEVVQSAFDQVNVALGKESNLVAIGKLKWLSVFSREDIGQ